MKYLKTNVLSVNDTLNAKGVYKADILVQQSKRLQNGEVKTTDAIMTISSKVKLSVGEQLLKIESEYLIDGKTYITVSESSQELKIQKK